MSDHDPSQPGSDHAPDPPDPDPTSATPPAGSEAEATVTTAAPSEPYGDITAEPEEKKGGSFLRELPILILIAFALAMLIKTFLVQAFYIPSESMRPTLERHDRVLVNKIVYRIRDPRRGEIVVFVGERDDRDRSFLQRVRDVITEGLGAPSGVERDFIKRVIALPGETVEVTRDGAVLVTTTEGERMTLREPYLASHDPEDDSSFGPFTVPADTYFVMGDNRDNSADSRSTLGPIARDDILGKAFVRIWPPGRFGFFRTPSYDLAAAALPLAAGLVLVPLIVTRRRR